MNNNQNDDDDNIISLKYDLLLREYEILKQENELLQFNNSSNASIINIDIENMIQNYKNQYNITKDINKIILTRIQEYILYYKEYINNLKCDIFNNWNEMNDIHQKNIHIIINYIQINDRKYQEYFHQMQTLNTNIKEQYELQREEYERIINEKNKSYQNMKQQYEDTKQQYDEIKQEFKEAKQQHEDTKQQYDELKESLNRYQIEYNQKIEDMEAIIQREKSMNNNHSLTIENITELLNQVNDNISNIQIQYDIKVKEYKELEISSKQIQLELQEVQRVQREKESSISTSQSNHLLVQELQSQVHDALKHTIYLEEQVNHLQGLLEKSQQDLMEVSEVNRESLLKQLNESNKQQQYVQVKVQEKELIEQQLRHEIKVIEDSMKELKEVNELLRLESMNTKNNLQHDIQCLNISIESLVVMKDKLQYELKEKDVIIISQQETIHTLQKQQQHHLEQENIELKHQIQSLENIIRKECEERIKLKEEIASLQEQVRYDSNKILPRPSEVNDNEENEENEENDTRNQYFKYWDKKSKNKKTNMK